MLDARHACAARGLCGSGRGLARLRGAFGGEGHHRLVDAGNGQHGLLDGAAQDFHGLHMLGRGGEREHHPAAVDGDIGDQSGGHHVAAAIRSGDALQNGENVFLCDLGHGL